MKSNTVKPKKLINIHCIKSTKPSETCFVWAHGWTRTHEDLKGLADQISDFGDQYLIDLPAHADTCPSSKDLSIEEYLKPIIDFIDNTDKPIIWIGHSFGCRIGAHIGNLCPKKIKALFLICPPFNKNKTWHFSNMPRTAKQYLYKGLVKIGIPRNTILPFFASKDYQNANELRALFVKWVNEDSAHPLKTLKMPVRLIFAENDTATPPELNKYFKMHCTHVTNKVLKHFDHFSILTEGQYQIIHSLIQYIKELKC